MPLSQFEVECREGPLKLALWDIQPFADESENLVSIGGLLRTLLCRGSFARRFSEVRFDHDPGAIRVVGVYEAPYVERVAPFLQNFSRPWTQKQPGRSGCEPCLGERCVKKVCNIVDQIMIGGLRATHCAPGKQGQHRFRAHDAVKFSGIMPLGHKGRLREEYQGPSPVPGRIRLLRSGPLADCLRCVRTQRAGGRTQCRLLPFMTVPGGGSGGLG